MYTHSPAFKTFTLIIIMFIGFSLKAQPSSDIAINQVVKALKSNDTKLISSKFNSTIDVVLEEIDDNFSKTQAGVILDKFIKDNKCNNFIVNQKGSASNNSVFIIGNYSSNNDKVFRVYLLFKEKGAEYLIYMMEFEEI